MPAEMAQNLHAEQHFVVHLRHDEGGYIFKCPTAEGEHVQLRQLRLGDAVGGADLPLTAPRHAQPSRQ